MEPLHIFLGRFAPFHGLPDMLLAAVAGAADEIEVELAAGDMVLVEDGPPALHLHVIRSGSIALVHQGETVDVLGRGEVFGHPSMLSGLAPSFTVRALGPASIVRVPREQALAVLGRPEGTGFVATTLRDRLTRTGHTVHGLPALATIPVAQTDRPAPALLRGLLDD